MKKTGLRYLLGEGVKFANEASGNLYIRCEQIRAEDGTYLMQMIVPAVLKAALHIFLTAIERVLRQHSPDASAASRLGAVIFIPLWRATQHATVRPPHRGQRYSMLMREGQQSTVTGLMTKTRSMSATGRILPKLKGGKAICRDFLPPSPVWKPLRLVRPCANPVGNKPLTCQ